MVIVRVRLNERTGKMPIENFVGAQLPFPFFFVPSSLLLLPLFPNFLTATAKKSRVALKLLSGSERNMAAKRHLVNFGLKECFW